MKIQFFLVQSQAYIFIALNPWSNGSYTYIEIIGIQDFNTPIMTVYINDYFRLRLEIFRLHVAIKVSDV